MTLSRLASLLSAASMRPWVTHPTRDAEVCINSERDGEYLGNAERNQDADLIVAAVNALPALLRIAQAAEALVKAPVPTKSEVNDFIAQWSELELALATLEKSKP